jgi:hypothetical protein
MARRRERRRMATKNRDELTKPEEKSTILGLLAEQHARERYGLRIPPGGRTSWKDAEYQNGTPVNPKAAQPDRRFRIFEKDHDILTSQQGYYVFVVYEPVTIGDSLADSRIDVKAMRRKKATDVTKLIDGWNRSDHEKGRQKKLQVKAVFPGEGVAKR